MSLNRTLVQIYLFSGNYFAIRCIKAATHYTMTNPTKYLRIFFLALLCGLSSLSYRYLQAARLDLIPGETSSVESEDFKDKSKDSAQVRAQDESTLFPDIELLKFLLKKSREGMPVLRFDKWFGN